MKNNNKFFSFILLVLVLISIKFFNYRFYTGDIMRVLDLFSILIIVLFYILNKNRICSKMYFKREILFLVIWPFLVSIPCYIFRGQSITLSLLCGRVGLAWLLYFILHKIAMRQETILKIFKFVAFTAVGIFIIQQLLYPDLYLFGEPEDSEYVDEIEYRNGLLRFRIFDCVYYMIVIYFIYLTSLFQSFQRKNLIVMFFLLLGVYLTLTRQTWIISLLPFPIYYIFISKMTVTRKFIILIMIITLCSFLYINLSVIIGDELVETTTSQIESDDDARALAYYYFGVEYWNSFVNVLLGNGIPAFGTPYYNHIISMKDLHMFRSDVGIVGTFSTYGLIYCLVFIYIHFKILKRSRYLSPFLTLTFIASLINLPFAAWCFPILMSCLLYIVDIELNNNILIENENTCNRC